ncbi:RNA polymerase sigma factor [Kitasatospora brasiliensis]|uniref:RNA polymerase sigma factor n=1 Tax=Kitasatospora brasiliensis TaxID=3058040 RepID=UPI002930C5C7|nr:RNA polymerase sigma factor [Kitasatospora sp. K002]
MFTDLLPRLHQAAASLSGSPLGAGDVVHDAYLRIARSPERFLGHPQPYAYAFTTMVNILRDQWRRERRRVSMPEVPDPGDAVERDRGVSDPQAGGMVELQAHWEVLRLLSCLTAKQARAVALVDLDGYSVDEAAELLGLHRSTLAVTRRRAHGRLRTVLAREREREREPEREPERERERECECERERGRGRGRESGPGRASRARCPRRPDAPS